MKMIPFEKMSKKERKRINAEKRNLWGMNPVTRTVKNKKAFDSKKACRSKGGNYYE